MARQYSGTAGRIENCQIGVFLGYAGHDAQALIDRALYLPADWAKDKDRRRKARIPEDVAFTTKPKLGLAMLERARQAAIPFTWITGDCVYGADSAIRRWAERHRYGYGLAVTSGQYLGQRPVTSWIEDLPAKAWQRLSAGDGAKGPRLYDWTCVAYNGAAAGFRCALLVRRSIGKPAELAFYLTHAPEATAWADLARIADTRWRIESLFEQAKGEVGLDQYEVRSWVGWHRHITLAMFALAYLAAVRAAAIGGVDPINLAATLLPLTIPEVRHLLWALVSQTSRSPGTVLHWSAWQRKHQQRARRAHWHRRMQVNQYETRL